MSKRFDWFKAIVICIVFASMGLFLFVCYSQNLFDKLILIKNIPFSNGLAVSLLTVFFAVLISFCIIIKKDSRFFRAFVIFIYISALVMSMSKMLFYSEKVAATPDETAHIGYIAYLTQEEKFFFDYENIKLPVVISDNNETMVFEYAEGTVNYLFHPPLYYNLMRLSNGISFDSNGNIIAKLDNLRMFSQLFAVAALVLMFYIGYTRIKASLSVHLLFTLVCTSVPMMLYGASGVNNDTLAILTVTVFIFGIIRYLENKRSFATYLLIAFGIVLTMLTKVSAGIITVLAAVLVLVITLIKEKNAKQLITAEFLVSLPVYLLGISYFIYIYFRYGSFQPGLFSVAEEYAKTTGFFVPEESRAVMNFFEYTEYFFYSFIKSWTGILSHKTMLKATDFVFSADNIALVLILLLPLLFIIKPVRKSSIYTLGILSVYVSVLTAFVMQFINGYSGFCSRGYLGGFQSRYYLCAILIFAFAAAKFTEFYEHRLRNKKVPRRIMTALTLIFSTLLFYEDFIYFLLRFNNYIG